jgi:hypothetical protein
MIFDFPRDFQRFLLFVLPPEAPLPPKLGGVAFSASFTAAVEDFVKQAAKAALHIDRQLELSG